MTININPVLQTNAAGTFSITSEGYIQGCAIDDPALRNELAGGILDSGETLPMWGGVAITENINSGISPLPQQSLGNRIVRATSIASTKPITGFSVFDQNHSAINTPQSPVPLVGSGMTMNFYRTKSGIRIPVKCDPALVDQYNNPINTQFSWDFVNQQLVEYSPAYAGATISGATWASTGGGQVNFVVNTDYQALLTAGDRINVSGVVNTGGASTSAFNGSWVVVSVPDATHVVVAAPASGSIGTYASGGAVVAGGGAVPATVLEIRPTGNMTVIYDPVTGYATWDRNGPVAVILLN